MELSKAINAIREAQAELEANKTALTNSMAWLATIYHAKQVDGLSGIDWDSVLSHLSSWHYLLERDSATKKEVLNVITTGATHA